LLIGPGWCSGQRKIKNHIRDLLLREGQLLPRGRPAWTEAGMTALAAMAQPFAEVSNNVLFDGGSTKHGSSYRARKFVLHRSIPRTKAHV